MISKLIFVSMMALSTLGQYTPSYNTYLFGLAKLFPEFSVVNLFDGPSSISNAPTTPTVSAKPTLEQMKYYNYYAVSMYCPYELNDLSCNYCQHFKKNVNTHKVIHGKVFGTLAMVTISECRKEIVIAYRGTYNIATSLLDAVFYNGPIPGQPTSIKMHRGFYIATMSLYGDVVKSVGYLRTLHPDYKIVITGHSLGAAMARITQFLLLSMNQFPGATYEVFTYGEPRVGNKYFADFINSQNVTTARIVARGDYVSHVPPTSLLGTRLTGDYYVHPQSEFWINGKDEQRFCNQSVYEDPTCSQSVGPTYTTVDHITFYFDVNYTKCSNGHPSAVFELPLIFQPVRLIPPIPKYISNFAEGAANFIFTPISAIYGC